MYRCLWVHGVLLWRIPVKGLPRFGKDTIVLSFSLKFVANVVLALFDMGIMHL